MRSYYAKLNLHPNTDPNNIQCYKARDIQDIYDECLAGFANSTEKSPPFRIAVICTKYPELPDAIYRKFCCAYASNVVGESYIPSKIAVRIDKSNLDNDVKKAFSDFGATHDVMEKDPQIHRSSFLCIGIFDCQINVPDEKLKQFINNSTTDDITRFVNDLTNYQVILPLLFHLLPDVLIEDDYLQNITNILIAVKDNSSHFINTFFLNCSNTIHAKYQTLIQQLDQKYNLDQLSSEKQEQYLKNLKPLRIYPSYFRLIIHIPLSLFEKVCAVNLPYIDRVIQLETDDSLSARFDKDLQEQHNPNLKIEEFLLQQYPNLQILSEIDKYNTETPKTYSNPKQ